MKQKDQQPGNSFPTTQWTDVGRVRSANPQVRKEAIGNVLAQNLPAFRAYLQRCPRVASQQAEDLLQSFICDLLIDKDLISRADRTRGRLRDLLRIALDRYVFMLIRRQCAGTRTPPGSLTSIDKQDVAAPEAADQFNRAWAKEVIQRSIEQMRDQYVKQKKEQVWLVFETCTLKPLLEGIHPPPHREVMERAGLNSEQAVSNRLVTGKRMFTPVLRQIVGEYAGEGSDIDDELKSLMAILSQNAGAAPAQGLEPEGSRDECSTL